MRLSTLRLHSEAAHTEASLAGACQKRVQPSLQGYGGSCAITLGSLTDSVAAAPDGL